MYKNKKINYLDFPLEVKLRGKFYLNDVKRVLNKGSYVLGEEVDNFEKEFAKFLGIKYCVGTANGLEALQIALMAKGIGPGDEVITTPISAVATTLAILAVGATPVFADITEMGQIDPQNIEKLITKKTKAVIPVDLYGQPCDLEKIRTICKKYKLFLLEDACQAHGSTLKNKKLGTYGDVGAFSFYPTKNLGAFGDGGALVTNDKKLAELFRQIRDYGQESKYIHVRYGLNSRLDELHAALLRTKLKFLKKDNLKRLQVAKKYISQLKSIDKLTIVLPKNINDSNFHLFVIKTEKRDLLKKYLGERGIPTLIHYPLTIPEQKVITTAKVPVSDLPISRKFVSQILSLPCHPFMKLEEVSYVCKTIQDFFRDK